MKYTNTYINSNVIESAVMNVFSDVLLNIRPGLFSLDIDIKTIIDGS